MRGRLFRTSTLLLSGSLALAACSGDDDDDAATDDADDTSEPDAGDGVDAGGADAAPPILLRAGTIAVTETSLTNSKVPVSGAVVGVSFLDVTTATVAPVEGFNEPIDGCLITVYDVKAGESEPTLADEGEITVTGTANGEFRCAADGGVYSCQSTERAIAGGVVGNADGASLDGLDDQLTMTGAAFPAEMQGMSIGLTGFGTQDGIYPIIAVLDPETLQLGNIDESVDGSEDATFTTFVGQSPIPNFAGFDFLDDGVDEESADIVVAMEDSEIVPSTHLAFKARGDGLELAGPQPHEFPLTLPAQDLTFECAGEGCGSNPDQVTGVLDVMIMNGRTTDRLPEDDDSGIEMLDAVNSYAVFQCSTLLGDQVAIPSAGLEAILGTNPARIELTVGRFAAVPRSGGEYRNNILVGHSLTGYTTVPAK
jgi:hypothetical protein